MVVKIVNKKNILIIVVLLFVLGVFFIFTIISHMGKAKLVISVAPKDAIVHIDNVKIGVGTTYINPGKHIVKIDRQGFTPYNKQFETPKNTTTSVTTVLISNSQEGINYEKAHPEEFINIEKLMDQENDNNVKKINQNYPLVSILPIDVSPLYTIAYGVSVKYPNNSAKIAIYIYASTPTDRQYALRDLNDRGYDVSGYEIVFGVINESSDATSGG